MDSNNSEGVDDSEMADTHRASNAGSDSSGPTRRDSDEGVKLPPKPSSFHHRNISWGKDQVYGNTFEGDTQDRVAPDAATSRQRLRGMSDTSEITADSQKKQRGGSSMSITLDDIRKQTPRESEAETYIIRALEEREEASGEPLSVVNNISEMAAEALSSVLNNSRKKEEDDQSSSMGSRSSAAPGTLASSRQLSTNTSASPTTPRSRRRLNSATSTRHVRTLTMEERLYDLTSTLGTLYNEGAERGNTSRVWADPSTEYTIPTSSADAFQQNASILYRRVVGDDSGSTAVPATSEAALPEHSRASVPSSSASNYSNAQFNSKKDDDVPLDGIQEASDEGDEENQQKPPKLGQAKKRKKRTKLFREVKDFFGPQRGAIYLFFRVLFIYAIVPGITIALILFYAAGNPPTGKLMNGGKPVNGTLMNTDGEIVDSDKASASWWLLFLVRQAVTATLAKTLEFIVIEFFTIRTRGAAYFLGPWATLVVLQSRGWPFLLIAWSLVDFLLLSGLGQIGKHWLHWQDALDVFNDTNPSGSFVGSEMNHRILGIVLSMGIAVSIKRFMLGLYLGKQTFLEFSGRLEAAMSKIILISEVASLAHKIERLTIAQSKNRAEKKLSAAMSMDAARLESLLGAVQDESSAGLGTAGEATVSRSDAQTYSNDYVIDPFDRHPLTGQLSSVQKAKITQLLGAWEEPKSLKKRSTGNVSINALLQFRRALACLKTDFPFSPVFGLADTREHCIESAQEVYEMLLSRSEDDILNYDLLAVVALQEDDTLDQAKAQELIKLFRPERDGSLDVLSFVKSIDMVYKEIRMLRASVDNASKIDRSFEGLFNIVFYAIAITIILSRLGFDPLALFLSISGVVLGFAFMISSASSKYFEGLLFILVRRPFQIGDAIHVSSPDSDPSFGGSAWWVVENVNLFTTEVCFLYTMEKASLSNGSLANSRIINSTRSTEPYLWFTLKFPVDVTFDKLQIFQRALNEFVHNRPRDWLSYIDFRATNVQADKGYIEYLVGSQFRSNWSQWTQIMLGKADLVLFSTELQKKLGIVFRPPSLPVDLSIKSSPANVTPFNLETIKETEPSGTPGLDLNESLMSDIKGLDSLFPYRTFE